MGLFSGVLNAVMGRSAAKRQEQAGRDAIDTQKSYQQQNYEDLLPYISGGKSALERMLLGLGLNKDGEDKSSDPYFGSLLKEFQGGDLESDPGYQFRLSEGEKAINRNALARGRYNSGSALKALQSFNSGLASQEFGNAFNRFNSNQENQYNRLAGAANAGQNALFQTNADRTQLGRDVAGHIGDIGNAGAAWRVNAGRSLGKSFDELESDAKSGMNFWGGMFGG